MKSSGIQIIGTQRSGSNLLRVILDQSADIASPHPPHLLTTFYPLLDLYQPLTDDENYARLVNDVVDYVNANPVPWEGVVLQAEEILAASGSNSLLELNRLIYERAASAKQAKYWCCKSMNNVYYASDLEAQEEKLKYIYLYRDGRDVAASFKKAVVGEKHSYHLAKQWSQDQEACIALSKLVPKERFFSLNYEELISDPKGTVEKLCTYLDIPYQDNMLEYYKSSTSKITAASGEMWSNLEKPILNANTGKFLKEFKGDDLEIFELVAGETLTTLGYSLHTKESRPQLLSEELVAGYSLENKSLKQDTLVNARASDLEKRAPQERILKNIKERVSLMV